MVMRERQHVGGCYLGWKLHPRVEIRMRLKVDEGRWSPDFERHDERLRSWGQTLRYKCQGQRSGMFSGESSFDPCPAFLLAAYDSLPSSSPVHALAFMSCRWRDNIRYLGLVVHCLYSCRMHVAAARPRCEYLITTMLHRWTDIIEGNHEGL